MAHRTQLRDEEDGRQMSIYSKARVDFGSRGPWLPLLIHSLREIDEVWFNCFIFL